MNPAQGTPKTDEWERNYEFRHDHNNMYATAYHDLLAFTRALEAARAGVPEEPTEQMVQAAIDAGPIQSNMVARITIRRMWKAMLSAAPSPSAERPTVRQAALDFSEGKISSGKLGELLGLQPGELHGFKNACHAFDEPSADTSGGYALAHGQPRKGLFSDEADAARPSRDTHGALAALIKLAEEEWDEQPSGEAPLIGKYAVIDFLHMDEVRQAIAARLPEEATKGKT